MADSGDSGGARSGGARGRMRNTAAALTIIFLMVLATVFIAARTEAFRDWVREELEKRTGMALSIERTKIGWPFALVIRGLKSKDADKGELQGISLEELRLGWGLTGSPRIAASGCRLKLERLEDGSWMPQCLGRLGDLRQIEQVGELTDGLRKKHARLSLKRVSIQWYDSDSSRLGRIGEMDFALEPVRLSRGREMSSCTLSAYEVVTEDGARLVDVRREWLFTDDGRPIEIEFQEGTEMAPGGHDLWRREGGPAKADGPAPDPETGRSKGARRTE